MTTTGNKYVEFILSKNPNALTISGYLQQALQDGYPWAQAALDNFVAAKTDDVLCLCFDQAIVNAFSWKDSSEGNDYWYKVWYEVYTEPKKEKQ